MNAIKRVIFMVFLFAIIAQAEPTNLDVLVDYLESKIKAHAGKLFIVAIGGCPGVGKTTLANQLALLFSLRSIQSAVLHLDDFNRSAEERRSLGEWDLSHLHLDRLQSIVDKIGKGETKIRKPTYSQITGECGEELLDLTDTRILFFEGLYTTCSHGALNFLSFSSESIFVDADEHDVRAWKKKRNEKRIAPRSESEFEVHMNGMIREYKKNIAYSKYDASVIMIRDSAHGIAQLTFKNL